MYFVPDDFDDSTVLRRRTHTCFDDLVATVANLTSYMFMADTIQRGVVTLQHPGHPFEMDCQTSSVVYVVFPYPLSRLLAEGLWPTEIRLYENVDMSRERRGGVTGPDHQRLVRQIIGSSFVRYFESMVDVLRRAAGRDPDSWPGPWNFARILRNAFAHDGIWFADPMSDPLSWRGVTFGPQNNGEQPLFPHLGLGDVVALYLELDEAIAGLGT